MPFKTKLHSHGYFIAVNAIIAMLIACRYFFVMPEIPSDLLGFSFLVSSVISHMATLTALIGLILIPLLLLPTIARRLIISGISSFILITLFIDTIVFSQYRFHISMVMLELVMSGQVVSFPLSTWLMTIFGILALWALQYALIVKLDKNIPLPHWKLGRKFAWITFITLLISHGIHIWAAANVYQPVTMTKKYLPLFQPSSSTATMRKMGWINEEAIKKQQEMKVSSNSDLNYPLQPIQTQPVNKPTNIVFIVVDSWRADTFNAETSPNMWAYAQKGKILHNHISSGNATRTGIFGLFYGLPGTYWQSVLSNRKTPVFMDRLQAMDYQLGIFAAAKLTNPEFDRTIFAKVPNLRISSIGSSPDGLDVGLTQDWLKWFDNRDKSKPTFSFLFYDSPHGYAFPKDYPHQFKPMLEEVNYLKLSNDTDRSLMMNRYKTSVHYVDSIVKQVLDKIEASGEADNTLVIITGDHGQEVNDNMENFWGHNGNFTDPQVKVPFAIIGPKINDSELMNWDQHHFTSHHDVVPTLMKNYLGVTNNIKDYSIGEDLLGLEVKRDWVLTSSYSRYAVVTAQDILEVGAVGQYDFLDKSNKPIKGRQFNGQYLQSALEQMSRFNK
ncbi:DUF3413 domain-containing protein [Acinetobacter faecalis]|uniref:DUF3413 domain-containing protein n=1 Tax=Acinetobacter faecalis TaxID=2665161 RepID=UPI002A90E783|nr:DUF3413 domain-containing protein [Acinetobacter faecalis]MDY6484670.1 DUF3413 domain-containing protein [Acinetobacter faecalis]